MYGRRSEPAFAGSCTEGPGAREVGFWKMRPGLPSPAAPGAGPLTRLQFREGRFTTGMYHGRRMRPALGAGSLYEWRAIVRVAENKRPNPLGLNSQRKRLKIKRFGRLFLRLSGPISARATFQRS